MSRLLQNIATMVIAIFMATCSWARPMYIGIPNFNPPYEISVAKNISTGFDADLMKSVCSHLQIQCEFKTMAFSKMFRALKNKEIDVAIGNITITGNRKLNYLFSIPYIESYASYLTRSGDNFTDIKGKRLSVMQGTIHEVYVQAYHAEATTIVLHQDHADQIDDLANYNVDIILIDSAAAEYWEQKSDGVFKIFGPKIKLGPGVGIMALPENKLLMDKINQALLTIGADGDYVNIYKKYFQ